MLGGIEAALTGMQAASRMLGTSAHNIANAQNEGFKRIKAISEEGSAGGVRINFEQDPTSGPSFFTQDENGLSIGEGSNVDLIAELTNALEATHLFEANVASFKAQNKTLGSLLDILE